MTTGLTYLMLRQLGVPLLFAILATCLITPPLLLLYRRRVADLMTLTAGESPPLELPQSPSRSALPAAERLRRRSRAVVRARARGWFLGFAFQAVVLTIIFAARYASVLSAPAIMIALVLFLIPAALVFLTVSTVSGWTRLLVFGAGLLVLSIWPSPTGDLLRAIALLYVMLPVMPLLLFHLRFWRGAAPLVFLLSLIGFSGSVLAMGLVSGALGIGFGPFAWLARFVGFAVGLGVGVWFLRRVTKRHTRAPITEHAFALDTWWLLYTLVQSFVVSIGLGIGAGSVVLLSFLLGRWITQRALGRIDGPEAAPLRLLLLRVFGNSRRSERLFEQLAQAWSPLGSIELIGGADLALQQVSPLDFLAFLTGRLRQRFGQSPSETAARLATLPSRGIDGSYSACQTFCHADVWEPTMRRMMDSSDAVVMDLREFQAERSGCRVELEALARSSSHRPIVLVIDESTDLPLVRQLLTAAGAEPARPPWHFVTASRQETTTVAAILAAVGAP